MVQHNLKYLVGTWNINMLVGWFVFLIAPHVYAPPCSVIGYLPIPISGHQLGYAQDPHVIYIFGGLTTSQTDINSIYKWNVSSKQLTTLDVTTPTPFRSYSNNAASINDRIYFIGTGDYWNHMIYLFDTTYETWLDNTNIAEPPQSVLNYGCLATNTTHLFFIGGQTHAKKWSDHLQIYDIDDNAWTAEEIDILPIVGDGWSVGYCEYVNNNLYIFGGETRTDYNLMKDILKWNPSQKWQYVGDLPIAQGYGVALRHYDSIYIIGGVSDGGGVVVSSIYDFNTNENAIINQYFMTQTLADLAAVIINHQLYIFGGWNDEAVQDIQICDILQTSSTTTHAAITLDTTASPTSSNPTNNPNYFSTQNPTLHFSTDSTSPQLSDSAVSTTTAVPITLDTTSSPIATSSNSTNNPTQALFVHSTNFSTIFNRTNPQTYLTTAVDTDTVHDEADINFLKLIFIAIGSAASGFLIMVIVMSFHMHLSRKRRREKKRKGEISMERVGNSVSGNLPGIMDQSLVNNQSMSNADTTSCVETVEGIRDEAEENVEFNFVNDGDVEVIGDDVTITGQK